jgi:hypothetical protein
VAARILTVTPPISISAPAAPTTFREMTHQGSTPPPTLHTPGVVPQGQLQKPPLLTPQLTPHRHFIKRKKTTHSQSQQYYRDIAKQHIKTQRERIAKAGASSVPKFNMGEYVSVLIPKRDRAKEGRTRIIGRIIKVTGKIHRSHKIRYISFSYYSQCPVKYNSPSIVSI